MPGLAGAQAQASGRALLLLGLLSNPLQRDRAGLQACKAAHSPPPLAAAAAAAAHRLPARLTPLSRLRSAALVCKRFCCGSLQP